MGYSWERCLVIASDIPPVLDKAFRCSSYFSSIFPGAFCCLKNENSLFENAYHLGGEVAYGFCVLKQYYKRALLNSKKKKNKTFTRERERERAEKTAFKVDKIQNHTIAGILGKNVKLSLILFSFFILSTPTGTWNFISEIFSLIFQQLF